MAKSSKSPAAKTAKATREDRAAVMVAAHHFFKVTGLPWGVCQLAAWENWRLKKFEELRLAQEKANAVNGSMVDKVIYSFVHTDPNRLKDAVKRQMADNAWWSVVQAMKAA